ncbi:MAG: nuclease, partial [Alphaproteobacteria bacterium]|nr:nuclease [Alphaproteobacteria bacterium]
MPRDLKLIILFFMLIPACGRSSPLEALVPGEHGRVVRIIDGDGLVLDTGQSVRLVGLAAPSPERRERPGEPFAENSSRMLEDMALGRRVRLYYAGLTRDRYDRALAHVVTQDALGPRLWLNREMALRGGARVRTWPDTALAAGALIEAERRAREAGRGLWALDTYQVRKARELTGAE